MEPHSPRHDSRNFPSARWRFPDSLAVNDEELDASLPSKVKRTRRSREMLLVSDLWGAPWLGWLFVYAFVLFCFSFTRCLALRELVIMYSSPKDYTRSVKLAALGLGFMEDFVCTTYFACTLWLFDSFKHAASKRFNAGESGKWTCVRPRTAANIATFIVSWLLFVAMMAPFAADLLLVVNRDMRFTFDLIALAISEKEFASAAPISSEEIGRCYAGATVLGVVALLFASVRAKANWTSLSSWDPTHLVMNPVGCRLHGVQVATEKAAHGVKYVEVALEEGVESEDTIEDDATSKLKFVSEEKLVYHYASRFAIALGSLVVFPALVVAVRCQCSPLVAYAGMNATLNELFAHAFQPAPTDVVFANEEGDQPWVKAFIHPSEKYELFGDESLYRRTTGFQGELAFDVSVEKDNPPNVLVIGVESFRFQDSHYLVGDKDPSDLFKGTNMTITPNFDKWAKRGVALRNLWSSSPTSRSLESLLFAQVPYDSTVKTGITGGRKDTKLSGLPQFFKAKKYETYFTTGCPTRFENWNVFLPSHGYDVVLESKEMKLLAESKLGIKPDDWRGDANRGFKWGVHDDINLQLLGDMLLEKTKLQSKRVADGKRKKPLFVTHYTISSHAPYKARPTWYKKADKPDFSALYEGEKHAKDIKNYLEMRHFTDMELGKFMDRMEKEGVLNDTIVVIVGDHGQAPEAEVTNTHEESVTRVAGAIIAEGRLGEAAGLVIEDAVEHYDILNTLADITGVPKRGFVQNGVGRSLKRKARFGERVVFANDPSRKMAIVRGHQRLRYDQVTASLMLHDTETDHNMTSDLFPELSEKEQEEWKSWRDNGRRITAYYKKRWDENCLLAVNCTEGR